jgi:hypothetical protein
MVFLDWVINLSMDLDIMINVQITSINFWNKDKSINIPEEEHLCPFFPLM